MGLNLIIASNNKGKITEMRSLFEPLGYKILSQSDAGINMEIEETGTSFEENSRLKAIAIFDLLKTAVIADDSGLEVDALNGDPGVYSARYGGEGLNDEQRNTLLLKNLEGVNSDDRTARFVSVLHFINSDGKEFSVRGECEGKIGFEPIGENGFGYDPIFLVGEKSFSEISLSEKNKISHRAKALDKLIEIIKVSGINVNN